jgi:hypothetical protein
MGELHGCGWPGRAGRSTCAGKVEKTRLVSGERHGRELMR